MHIKKLSWLCLVVLPCRILCADFFSLHNTGWYFYDDPKAAHKKHGRMSTASALQVLHFKQQQLKRAKARLVMQPTVANARDYIQLQNAASEQSSRVEHAWKRALLYYPELDFSLNHPIRSVARRIDIDSTSIKIDQALFNFSKQQGLFFFYKSTCPYCRRFAPVVKRLSEHYHIHIIPISLDGRAFPLFPHTRFDAGQARRFGVHATPALFAINPQTKKVAPVSYGFLAEDEIKARLFRLATQGRAL